MRPLTKHGGLIRTLIATEDWRDEAAENREADLRAERDALAERVERVEAWAERHARRDIAGIYDEWEAGQVLGYVRAATDALAILRADDEARGE